jgi:hypothetical protein
VELKTLPVLAQLRLAKATPNPNLAGTPTSPEQRVLGSNQKCATLRFKHNVYSDLDWSARV